MKIKSVKQGHMYKYKGKQVMSLENAEGVAKVARVDIKRTYPLGYAFYARVDDLTPLPMAYFLNEIPE